VFLSSNRLQAVSIAMRSLTTGGLHCAAARGWGGYSAEERNKFCRGEEFAA
jgi:hypothetical protein